MLAIPFPANGRAIHPETYAMAASATTQAKKVLKMDKMAPHKMKINQKLENENDKKKRKKSEKHNSNEFHYL